METLAGQLKRAGTKERAVQEKRYLKSELVHYGVRVPETRKLLKQWLKTNTPTKKDLLWAWAQKVHELRVVVAETLIARPELANIKLAEKLLREAKTWALVDTIAPAVVQPMLEHEPALWKIVDAWATDDDFWMRRAALLVHLLPMRRGNGDWEKFNAYAEPLLDDKEFFIRKAMGWVLREAAKKQPQKVKAWLSTHACSPLTRREASKHL